MSILWQTLSAVFSGTQRAKRNAVKQLQAGNYASAALICEAILKLDPKDPVANRILTDIADAVSAAVERFRGTPGDSSEARLRSVRQEFLSLLKSLPRDSTFAIDFLPMTNAHSMLMESGLREFERNKQEESAFGQLRSKWMTTDSAVDVSTLLAIMLLGYSFELSPPKPFKSIPERIREKYCQFLLESPQVFQHPGDAAAHGEYLAKAIESIHGECIFGHSINHSEEARKFTHIATQRANFIQTYFTTQNLRGMMKMRGDLIAALLIFIGATILRACPPRERSDGKIKLGVFTISFGPNTDAHFAASHIDHLDRKRFHITLFVLTATGSSLERHCTSRADQFVILPADNLFAQAECIRAEDLDLLVFGSNLSAITKEPALLGGMRLARNQIASVCSPVTTGLRHMDIVLSALQNESEADADQHYTEQLWRMPGSVNVYAYQYDTERATINFSRADLHVPDGTIVFFSGAIFLKITPELSLTWGKILADVPNSVLVLMPFNPNWYARNQRLPFVTRIKRQFAELGVAPDRLRIVDPVPARADVHRVLATADVYLDAYPFAGACSMLDPIIVGVPPVVRSGTAGRSSHGAALMRMAGVEEVICTSEESYISTAIDLATNPARRDRIRAVFKELNAKQLPPYFDTRTFSSNVGDALVDIHTQYLERYRALETNGPMELRRKLQALADSLVGYNIELAALNDIGVVHSLVKPYFRRQQGKRLFHMIDVGACWGQMAEPLLADGWTADLFEPDPGPRPHLERSVAKYGSRCRVFATAVSNSSVREVEFHQSQNGLSGLGESPFKSTEAILKVPCTRLVDFYVEKQVKFVDFLKIYAEGYDFDVLDSHDFSVMRPSLVMVEYGTHFERESLSVLNQSIERMAAAGYGSVLFNYDDDGNFSKGKFIYRLTQILLDQPMPDLGRAAIGNVLFYLHGDVDFLLMLYALLDSCQPHTKNG